MSTAHGICPACGLPPESATERPVDGIMTADSICPLGHIWSVRWLATDWRDVQPCAWCGTPIVREDGDDELNHETHCGACDEAFWRGADLAQMGVLPTKKGAGR